MHHKKEWVQLPYEGALYQSLGANTARRELRKFATTFYALHKKSSLTCSAAPRFKTVTASLGHSFVTPTWELLRMF